MDMENKKAENRSVRHTKKRLKECLIALLKKKPYSSITVKELCDLADVNRGTFYYHYTDIFDMIKKVEEEFFNEFYELIDPIKAPFFQEADPYYILTKVFAFFDKNHEWCQIMLGPNGDMAFLQRVKKLVDEKCSSIWKEVGLSLSPEEYELFNSFIINGYIGLLETWLKTGRKQQPKEMAGFVTKIIGPTGLPMQAAMINQQNKTD
ncbi:MAG: TetR/AcrR family transcriptional regulator [Clostridia bacterium]|jgi:AcrR family transcriptional regulator